MSADPSPAASRRRLPAAPSVAGELTIAGFLVQPQLNRIGSPGAPPVQVEPKVMEVLLCLAASPGQVIAREALLDRVWQGAFVSDDVLTRSIGQLRRIFGDDVERPRVIETIRKRGYRLLATPVATREDVIRATATAAPAPAAAPSRRPARRQAARLAGRPAILAAIAILATVAILAAGLPWLASRFRAHGQPNPAAREEREERLLPVAGVPANAIRPAVSPDGTRVAFTWNGGTGSDQRLFVAGLTGGAPRAITTHAAAAVDLDARWSPDATLIAFARQARGSCQLFTVPAAGGPERLLGPCVEDHTGVSWSADGRWLAYAARPDLSAGAAGPAPVRLRLLDLVSLRSRDLTSPPPGIEGDHAPAFSPDGSRLAFVRTVADDVEDVFQIPAAPVRAGALDPAVRVTWDDAGIAGMDWLPNGRELVVSSDRGGIYSLWRVPIAGGTPRLLAGSGTKTKHPSTARRANVVVFESWLYDIGLWRTPLAPGAERAAAAGAGREGPVSAGSGREVPVSAGASREAPASGAGRGALPAAAATFGAPAREWSFQPQFSPDGRRVAFASTRSGTYELWLADADGGHPVQLTAMGGPHLASPRWSPDGRSIAFTAWPEGRAALYVVSAGGGAVRSLTPAEADAAGEMAPSWSRDGRSLYFVSRRAGSWQASRLDLATGRRTQVTTAGATSAAESADGRDLYFTRPDRPGLWRRALAAGDPTASLVVPALAPGDRGGWAVTAAGIYSVDRSPDDLPRVDFLSFTGDHPRAVAILPDLAWSGFAIAPDHRSLLYARAGTHDCAVVRLENP